MTVWLIRVVVALAVVVVVDRLLVAAERRGWVNYRHTGLSRTGPVYHALELHTVFDPGMEQVQEVRVSREEERSWSGAPPGEEPSLSPRETTRSSPPHRPNASRPGPVGDSLSHAHDDSVITGTGMLSELQRQKLSRYFRVYDIDDDGRIGPADFQRVLENVRILHGYGDDSREHRELREVFERRWKALRDSADLDHDDGVDLDEWLTYWDSVLADEERYEEEVAALVRRLFDTFDTDEDGVLGPDEFCDFYGIYGLSSALARQVFLDLDLDGDGAISRSELVEMSHEFYRAEDPEAPGNRLFGPY